jgi:DNA uptake protein ComE-like DNA-binding protein
MTLMQHAARAIVGLFALLSVAGTAMSAEVGGLVDPNTASETVLQQLPNMTPALAKGIVAHRPFKTVLDLNKFLLDQKLTKDQATAFYRKAFVKINLNTGTRDEFLLIPGVATRMSAEFAEYRPWKSWAQFDKEIGKYVGKEETDRLKQYFYLPPG